MVMSYMKGVSARSHLFIVPISGKTPINIGKMLRRSSIQKLGSWKKAVKNLFFGNFLKISVLRNILTLTLGKTIMTENNTDNIGNLNKKRFYLQQVVKKF